MTHIPRSTRKALLAMRDDLEATEGAKGEEEERGVSWPLERDEPELERSHDEAERGEDDFA